MKTICDKCNGSGLVNIPHMERMFDGDSAYYRCKICGTIANYYFNCNCGTTKRKHTVRPSKDKKISHRGK